ncbi:hypothetical protein PoB_003586300 [Plakobranchus ocellatus]|uniref:Uncharacterized protein n=1 Tax=Plakobranchus ocellatus TaxID=259542 RepID=A0AAV4AS16_9GAST|nr:hypothetical protein PoB_003586300 [Plakobranchus ocellatus]
MRVLMSITRSSTILATRPEKLAGQCSSCSDRNRSIEAILVLRRRRKRRRRRRRCQSVLVKTPRPKVSYRFQGMPESHSTNSSVRIELASIVLHTEGATSNLPAINLVSSSSFSGAICQGK